MRGRFSAGCSSRRPRPTCGSLFSEESGQALVEFALVALVFLLLVSGTVEVARVGHAWFTVLHASREGARVGVLGYGDQEIVETVRRAAAALDPARLEVIITPDEAERVRGQPLEVRVRYGVDLVAPLVSSWFEDPFPVEGYTVMRME